MPEAPELILTGGPVLTMDPAAPQAEALAVRGGTTAALGTAGDVLSLRGPRTEVVDLGGQALLPGLVEAHGHPAMMGLTVAPPAAAFTAQGFPLACHVHGDVTVEAVLRTYEKAAGDDPGRLRALRPRLEHCGAVTALTRRAHPSGRVHGPAERLTLDEALRAVTVNPAWQLRLEHEIGMLRPGMRADLVTLPTDPRRVSPDAFRDEVRVTATYLGGRPTHASKEPLP
ncbi:amidohydrolase family protein [Streptomyces sp. NPDC001732]